MTLTPKPCLKEATMLVQVHTDRHIHAHARLVEKIQEEVTSALSRYSPQMTRVEVHLTDENAHKTIGDDKRCVLEARLSGLKPSAVTHDAPSVLEAVDGALVRLISHLESQLGRLEDKKTHPSFGHIPAN